MPQLTQLNEEQPAAHVEIAPAPTGPSFEELTAALTAINTTERAKAARELRTFGAAGIEPLCRALQDQELRVRLAAAKSLGEVGDERAISPLVAALRELFPGQSPRRARIVGILAAITFPLAMVGYGAVRLSEWGVSPPAIAAIIGTVLALAAVTGRKGLRLLGYLVGVPGPTDGGPCQVFSRALAQIAERCPAPELREALPALMEIASDGLQQNRRTRADSRKVARRIEELTARLDSLPVIASTPSPDVTTLPGASEGPK